MPYPDNFNSAAFDAQFADDDAVTRDDASRWLDGVMGRMAPHIDALIALINADYTRHLGSDAPTLTIEHHLISEALRELLDDEMEWGQFDD